MTQGINRAGRERLLEQVVDTGKAMREQQRRYFKERKQSNLIDCKCLEREFDGLLDQFARFEMASKMRARSTMRQLGLGQ